MRRLLLTSGQQEISKQPERVKEQVQSYYSVGHATVGLHPVAEVAGALEELSHPLGEAHGLPLLGVGRTEPPARPPRPWHFVLAHAH